MEEVWYLSKYHGWVAVNINVEEMLKIVLSWGENRVACVACSLLTDSTFCLRIRIVNFATEKVVILKHGEGYAFKTRGLQVSIMTDENCFEEIILEVATSRRFWLKGWKMLESNLFWNKFVQFIIITEVAVMFDLCCSCNWTESWLSLITD